MWDRKKLLSDEDKLYRKVLSELCGIERVEHNRSCLLCCQVLSELCGIERSVLLKTQSFCMLVLSELCGIES